MLKKFLAGLPGRTAAFRVRRAIRRGRGPATRDMGSTSQTWISDVSPREDFYRFANGGWLDRTEIPDDKSSYGTFTELYDLTIDQLLAILNEASCRGARADGRFRRSESGPHVAARDRHRDPGRARPLPDPAISDRDRRHQPTWPTTTSFSRARMFRGLSGLAARWRLPGPEGQRHQRRLPRWTLARPAEPGLLPRGRQRGGPAGVHRNQRQAARAVGPGCGLRPRRRASHL